MVAIIPAMLDAIVRRSSVKADPEKKHKALSEK
jgi:hypothetical protein